MQKFTIISRTLILLIASIFLFVTVPPAFSQTTPLKVTIIATSGEVLVLKKDATQWQAAQPGDILTEGDTIKTLGGAKAELQFPSGSSIVLNEETSLAIESLALKTYTPKKEEKTEVFLIDGKIKAIIEKLDKDRQFEIKTPTAIAGVRGTIFYLNVTRESERIMTGLLQDADEKILSFSLMDRLLGVKNCYAAFDGVITEIFVEEGAVDFTNLISQIAYTVGENQGAFADEEGNIPEPKNVPPDEQNNWKSGFEPPPPKDEGKKGEGADKKKGPPTKKAETSTVEKPAPPPPPPPPPLGDLPGPGDGDPDEGPGGPDEPPRPKDEVGTTSTSINIGVSTYEQKVREELVALHNDVANMGDSITLAELDNRLTVIQDAQEGKVMHDKEGYRVRSESYVWRPTDKKVAILHLTERNGGSHAGISSSTFEVAFEQSIAGANLKNDIPWAAIMNADAHNDPINYSTSAPAYHVKENTSGFDPTSSETPAGMVLTLRNPHGDYNRIYEGFGALRSTEGGYVQDHVEPYYNMNLNGALRSVDYGNTSLWAPNAATGGYDFEQANGTFYRMHSYNICDGGKVGSAQPITSIRNVLDPDRTNNLELTIEATEFGGRTIDTIVTPEIMTPYHNGE